MLSSQETMSGVVPVIDFGPFLQSSSQEERVKVAQQLVEAAKNVGFMMLKNYDSVVPKSKVDDAFALSKKFFDLPREVKDSLEWDSPESNRGYVSQGRERVSTGLLNTDAVEELRAKAPDYKETMEIGREEGADYPNKWPSAGVLDEFKPFFVDFYENMHILHTKVMSAIALGLGLPETFFDNMIDARDHNLRLLNYPSVETEKIDKGGNRTGAHSDYGSVTLLFQDQVGGLEVEDRNGEFVPATPVEGTIVVNIGDLLQRWSNDVLKSTIHRVVAPRTKEGEAPSPITKARQSIAFFSNPNKKQIIQCLPVAELGAPKYEPVECETWLVNRLATTFNVESVKKPTLVV